MNRMTGHMLRGVDYVEVTDENGQPERIHGDGRVYMWSNGALTTYRPDKVWQIIPAHRVLRIVGAERG